MLVILRIFMLQIQPEGVELGLVRVSGLRVVSSQAEL